MLLKIKAEGDLPVKVLRRVSIPDSRKKIPIEVKARICHHPKPPKSCRISSKLVILVKSKTRNMPPLLKHLC